MAYDNSSSPLDLSPFTPKGEDFPPRERAMTHESTSHSGRPSWHTTMLSPSPSPPRSPNGTKMILPANSDPERATSTPVPCQTPQTDKGTSHQPPTTPEADRRASLRLVYRSPPPLPRLDTATPIRKLSIQNQATSSTFNLSSPPPSKSRLPAIYEREFYPTPITVTERMRWPAPPFDDTLPRRPVPPPPPHMAESMYASGPNRLAQPSYIHPGSTYAQMRPRLSIHPYAPAPIDTRFYSAGGMHPHSTLSLGEKTFSSPTGAISPGFKAPRKRADDVQLTVLNDIFERTSYPSTKERDNLARQLGMTSRSVQIWFQNRRRAVKVEQQSAIQRVEADARIAEARARGLLPIPYLQDTYMGNPASSSPSPGLGRTGGSSARDASVMQVGDQASGPNETTIKREIPSPEGRLGARF